MIEIWKFFPDLKGKAQFKIYVEDRETVKNLLRLSGVRISATYNDSKSRFIANDLIVPGNRLKALYKLTGIKKRQIKFL